MKTRYSYPFEFQFSHSLSIKVSCYGFSAGRILVSFENGQLMLSMLSIVLFFRWSSAPANPPSPSSAGSSIDYKKLFDNINDPAELSHLIAYIGEFLSRIKTEQSEQRIKKDSKLHDVVQNGIKGASKLMEGISVAGDELDKMTNVISGVLKEVRKLHWIAVGLSLIELVSSVSKKRVHLLEILFDLSKHLQTLHDRMPDKEENLNKANCVIVEGIISCLCCMKHGTFFKYLFASIDEATLHNIETDIAEIYRGLSLMLEISTQEIGMGIRQEMPRRFRPSQYEAPDYAVDTDTKVETVIGLLDMDGKGPARARAVVLYGFGGIGKTTLAKCVLPRLDLTNFKHCKVELDEKCSDPKVYQEQLWEGLTKEKSTFYNYADGQQKLKEVLERESTRYFIFIDNVLRNEQINNILPTKFSLPSSSMLRLLVTSRQLGTVTEELKVRGRDVHCEKYHVEELPDDAAKYYFGQIVQSSGKIASALDRRLISRDHIDAVAEECHAIPLLLTVYAKYLLGNGGNPRNLW